MGLLHKPVRNLELPLKFSKFRNIHDIGGGMASDLVWNPAIEDPPKPYSNRDIGGPDQGVKVLGRNEALTVRGALNFIGQV